MSMQKNMGMLDRLARIAIVAVIALAWFEGRIAGPLALGLGIVAAIFALTSLVSFCPLYTALGISTRGRG